MKVLLQLIGAGAAAYPSHHILDLVEKQRDDFGKILGRDRAAQQGDASP